MKRVKSGALKSRKGKLTEQAACTPFSSPLSSSSPPTSWKSFFKTCLASSSRSFSVARAIHVIGVNLFKNLCFLPFGFFAASSHILYTKWTGSIGSCVLKNSTHCTSKKTGWNSLTAFFCAAMPSISFWIDASMSSSSSSSSGAEEIL